MNGSGVLELSYSWLSRGFSGECLVKPKNGFVIQDREFIGIEIKHGRRPNGRKPDVLIPERIKINDWGIDTMRAQFTDNNGGDVHVTVFGSYVYRGD
jgi:hypothetical protein